MYQVKHGSIPKIFSDDFSSVEHTYSTRFSRKNFQLPRSLKTSRFSIISRGPKIWNDLLSNNEKDFPSLFSFKYSLKKQILNSSNELEFF